MSLHIQLPSVATADTVEDLRRNVEASLNRIVVQINNYKHSKPLDANKNRITNLSDPSSATDAVNLKTLKNSIKNFSNDSRPNITTIINTNTIDGSAETLVQEFTLTTATTTITSATVPVYKELLTIYIAQDGTGGREVEWSTDFNLITTDIPTGANKRSIFHFFARSDNKWWPNSLPYLES